MTDVTNLQRAQWADAAIKVFRAETGTDYEDVLGDLLTDLMHWAYFKRFDFSAALARAEAHFEAEVQEP